MTTEYRIALTLAGGVSLGAFEAGVLDQLTDTLDYLNQTRHDRRYVIDIFTGGSAGAITSAAVAFPMIYNWEGQKGAAYDSWVKNVSMEKLLGNESSKNEKSLLDKYFLHELLESVLRQGTNNPTDVVPAPDRASFCPKPGQPIAMRFSMTNLHGWDYSLKYENPPGSKLITTFFNDYFKKDLVVGQDQTWQDWQDIGKAAIASGSFPFAFSPAKIERSAADYPGSDFPDGEERAMYFTDGGIFDNEPLREALRAGAKHDARDADQSDFERIFLLIDPSANRSKSESDKPEDRKKKITDKSDVVEFAKRLATVIRGQGAAKDMLRAERFNNELGWADKLLEIVIGANPEPDSPAYDRMQRQLSQLLAEMVADKKKVDNDPRMTTESLVKAVTDMRSSKRDFSNGDLLGQQLTAAFEIAAGQQHKRQAEISFIGVNENLLAGEKLQAFGGFFAEEMRQHDYYVGREVAEKILPDILKFERPADDERIRRREGFSMDMPDELRRYQNFTPSDIKKRYGRTYDRFTLRIKNRLVKPVIYKFMNNKFFIATLGNRVSGWVTKMIMTAIENSEKK